MAGQRQPLNVIQGKGRKHLTKAEIENRQKTEVKAKNDNVQPPKFLGAKQKKRFTEIANELLDLDIMANIDCEALGRLIVVDDEFVEINNRTLSFHLIDGTVNSIAGRLSDYEYTLLSHPEFLKIHRSYIINMDYMKALNQKSFITLTGKEIPISRNLLPATQKHYIEHLHAAIRNECQS